MEYIYYATPAIIALIIATCIFALILRGKNKKAGIETEELELSLLEANKKIEDQLSIINELSRYEAIRDIDAEIRKRKYGLKLQKENASKELQEKVKQATDWINLKKQELTKAQSKLEIIKKTEKDKIEKLAQEAKEQASGIVKDANQKKEYILKSSNEQAEKIIKRAETNAEEIAGEALRASRMEQRLDKTILAMRNTIKGYGEEFLTPPKALLDELAEQYNFKEAGQELKKTRDYVRYMISHNMAADCDYVEENRKHYAIHFVLDAFNGKVDTVLAKVRHDNYGKLKQKIIDAFNLVNHNGSAFRDAKINDEYLTVRLEELKWAVAVFELQRQDREEQKRIKQEIREEARAQKEFERAVKEAEKEEKMLQKAMAKARKELESATEAQTEKYEIQLKELETKLLEAVEKNQRAISMAQQTKRGHVYVISNHGSFGKDVLKIGLTRRLEPIERVKELGDASVPFPFDVHAMMYSENAPALERKLHALFENQRVNKINLRKEFFTANVSNVKDVTQGLGVKTQWTMAAEAREFKESQAIEVTQNSVAI